MPEPTDRGAAVGLRRGETHCSLVIVDQPKLQVVLHFVGVVYQCLARHASFVQADAAEVRFFDQSCCDTELCGPNRGHVAPWAAAEYDEFPRSVSVHDWPCCGSLTSDVRSLMNAVASAPSMYR